MAIAALLIWMCTAGVGSYLLVAATYSANREPPPDEPVAVPAGQPASVAQAATAAAPAAPAMSARDKNRFDPPSLQHNKSEPLPGMKDLADFAHPALAITGLGFWLGYVLSRERIFAAIGLGIVLGAICAGVGLFIVNTRAARRAAAAAAADDADTGEPGTRPLSASPLVLILHGAGAALTLLFVVLIAVHA